jgi:NADPH-dependent ferric siderophore reductase
MTEPDAKTRSFGRLEGAVTKLLCKRATVSSVRDIASGFRLVALAGEALQGVDWTPGQKVQLMLGGWVQRTYTPLSWDAERGVFELLAYVHGDGPGAAWARALVPGALCLVFGPRSSLDLQRLARPALLFGDETSFGLALALRFTHATGAGVHLVLEVSSKQVSSAVLDALDLSGALLIERTANDAHLNEVRELATRLVADHSIGAGVLSGRAPSIAHVGKHLRQLGLPRAQLQTKAYWAPGKTGLD